MLMFYSIHQVSYLFAHNKPLITLSTGPIDPSNSAVMGNFLNPAYVSNKLENYPVPMSFVNRVKNIFLGIVGTMTFKGTTRDLVQIEVSFYSYGAYGGLKIIIYASLFDTLLSPVLVNDKQTPSLP